MLAGPTHIRHVARGRGTEARVLTLARASPVTETSKQISLKSAVPTSAKSAYIESPSK